MKKRYTLLIAMMMLLTAIATNVFASAANNNSKVSPKELQEWFNGLSKEEKLSVNYELLQSIRLSDKDIEWLKWYNTLSKEEQLAVNYFPSQLLKVFSTNKVSKVNIDDKYETKTFLIELQNLYPTMETESINQYITSYIEIFNMYMGMYPNLSNKAIAEKAKANMLNKIEYMVDDNEYYKSKNSKVSYEPDGYELVVNYINENLNPGYEATLDTTEKNIKILKKNLDKMNKSDKELALLYIEDMESEDNFEETIAKKYLKTNILYRSSEKDAASKGVAYAKSIGRIIIPHFLIGVLIALILFLNLCMRGKKDETPIS